MSTHQETGLEHEERNEQEETKEQKDVRELMEQLKALGYGVENFQEFVSGMSGVLANVFTAPIASGSPAVPAVDTIPEANHESPASSMADTSLAHFSNDGIKEAGSIPETDSAMSFASSGTKAGTNAAGLPAFDQFTAMPEPYIPPVHETQDTSSAQPLSGSFPDLPSATFSDFTASAQPVTPSDSMSDASATPSSIQDIDMASFFPEQPTSSGAATPESAFESMTSDTISSFPDTFPSVADSFKHYPGNQSNIETRGNGADSESLPQATHVSPRVQAMETLDALLGSVFSGTGEGGDLSSILSSAGGSSRAGSGLSAQTFGGSEAAAAKFFDAAVSGAAKTAGDAHSPQAPLRVAFDKAGGAKTAMPRGVAQAIPAALKQQALENVFSRLSPGIQTGAPSGAQAVARPVEAINPIKELKKVVSFIQETWVEMGGTLPDSNSIAIPGFPAMPAPITQPQSVLPSFPHALPAPSMRRMPGLMMGQAAQASAADTLEYTFNQALNIENSALKDDFGMNSVMLYSTPGPYGPPAM